MVQRGLQSGIQQDSLFLGYYFGMSSDEFHSSSWQMNQQGLITGYTKIEYKPDYLKAAATKEFYPEFRDGRIIRMPVTIGYDAWAPWNREFWPDELIKELKEVYRGFYDAEFRRVFVPRIENFAVVSVQGNREIRIYQNSESTVMVEFIDHSAEERR
ncbi:MAG: hypothetical protein EA360_10525 [Balneolaceae bacterium]|nr:MAG: hypothetical protein EA360_10525 [Balneolaceae bacterium]